MLSHNFRRLSGTLLLSSIGIAVVVVSSLVFLRLGGSHQSMSTGPRLILGPNPASPGSMVTVSGFDFPESQPVRVYFQDPSHGVVNTTTNAGGFFNAGMKLPDHINNSSRVYAVSGSVTSFVPLQVMKPSLITVNNPLSQDGTAIINGKGFLANSPVTLTLSNGASSINEGSVRADQLGQISSNITIPGMLSDGQNTLVASDTAHNTAFVNFSASPTISVRPSSGYRGSRVFVFGTGFSRNENVTINFQGQQVATAIVRNGHFMASFIVPFNAVGGPGTITATGSISGAHSTTFHVISNLLIVPSRGFPGQSIAIFGGSFHPGDSVSVELVNARSNTSSVGVSMGSTTADSTGQIHMYVTVPNVPRGMYTIYVIDNTTGTSTSRGFTVG